MCLLTYRHNYGKSVIFVYRKKKGTKRPEILDEQHLLAYLCIRQKRCRYSSGIYGTYVSSACISHQN